MTFDAGTAKSLYLLDISDAEKKAGQLRSIFKGIAQDAATFGKQPLIFPSTQGAAQQAAALTRAQQQQALAAQKLATEQQKTNRAITESSRADQLLVRDTANAAAAQDRAASAALRRAAAEERAAKAAQNGGNGPALPRTFAGVSSEGLSQLGLAGGVAGLIAGGKAALDFSVQAGELFRQTSRADKSLQLLAGSNRLYTESLAAARAQQRLFGGSLQENIEGISGLVTVSRSSGAQLSTLIDLSQRLNIKDSSQGIGGARIAINEALSGDPTSLARRYEIPKAALAKLRDESVSTGEKLALIDSYLNGIGITSGVAAAAISKDAIALNTVNQITEQTTLSLGSLVSKLQGAAAQSATAGVNVLGLKVNLESVAGGARLAAQAGEVYVEAIQRGKSANEAALLAQVFLSQGRLRDTGAIQENTTAVDANAKAQEAAAARTKEFNNSITDGISKKQQQAQQDQVSKALQDDLSNAAFRVATAQSSQADEVTRLTRLYPAMADQIPNLVGQQLALEQASDRVRAALGRQRLEAQLAAKGAVDNSSTIGFNSPGRQGTSDVQAVVAQIAANKAQAEQEKQAVAEQTRALAFTRANAAQRVTLLRQELADLRRKSAAQSEILAKQNELEQAEQSLNTKSAKAGATRAKAVATTQDSIENRLEDSYIKQLQIQEDFQRKSQRSQEDYDLRASRSKEDYERQRRRLLAEGKIFEAQQLKETFDREQKRAQEDFQRSQQRSAQDEQIRLSRDTAGTGVAVGRIQDRAAIRGVRVGSANLPAPLAGQNAPLADPSAPPPTGAGNQTIQIAVTGAVYLDNQKVGDMQFPIIEQKFLDGVIQVQVSSAPQTANPLAGPRP